MDAAQAEKEAIKPSSRETSAHSRLDASKGRCHRSVVCSVYALHTKEPGFQSLASLPGCWAGTVQRSSIRGGQQNRARSTNGVTQEKKCVCKLAGLCIDATDGIQASVKLHTADVQKKMSTQLTSPEPTGRTKRATALKYEYGYVCERTMRICGVSG